MKKAVVSVIAIALTILLTLATIILVYVGINTFINLKPPQNPKIYISDSGTKTLYYPEKGLASIQISRGVDDADLLMIDFVFTINNQKYTFTTADIPDINGAKNYWFNLAGIGEPQSVSIIPLFSTDSNTPAKGQSIRADSFSKADVNNDLLETLNFVKLSEPYFYGINIDAEMFFDKPEDLEKLKQHLNNLSMDFARFQLKWATVETAEGVFNFEPYDKIMNALSEINTEPIIILGYSNKLYSGEITETDCTHLDDDKFRKHALNRYVPTDPERFQEWKGNFLNYVEQVVRHYPNQIYFEIWNEPNNYRFWEPNCFYEWYRDDKYHFKENPGLKQRLIEKRDNQIKQYIDVLNSAYNKIKEINSSAKILTGGIDSGYWSTKLFIPLFYKQAKFDILSAHSYCPSDGHYPSIEDGSYKTTGFVNCQTINNLSEWDSIAEEHEDNRKIWITETGFPSAPSSTSSLYTEENQKIWVYGTFYAPKKNKRIQGYFWHHLKNFEWRCEQGIGDDYPDPDYALLGCGWRIKPAYSTYKELVNKAKN